MAFTFSNAAQGAGGFGGTAPTSTAVQVSDGPELPEIQTDQLGFSAVSGDIKLRLLPQPWPSDNLPPPTSSLLAVASSKGLVAAAGPDTLVLAQTSTLRNAFHAPQEGTDRFKPVQPEVTVSIPRLSHIAFTADENVLVASLEQGGGILAYHVNQLTNGQTKPALELSTNNTSLRALIPNPAPESAHLVAAVTSNGELLVADFKAEGLTQGPNGPILKSGVSCLSWSNKGKALVAGLGDGTATQMKADGTVMTEIPKPTSIPADMHSSAISWLENDTFFAVYTPNDVSEDQIPPSEYWIISRSNKTVYSFQKLPEICGAWGMRRVPSFHYISRLRNFPPHIQDLLLVASTTSADIGLISKAAKPLSADDVTPGAYAFTTIGEDSRRAALPLSQFGTDDTSPIGVGFDLSSTEEVVNPIPSDPEIRQSSTPLPNYLVLNNEGVLASWWVVYNDSIREKTMYSGLVAASGIQQAPMQSPNPSREVTPAQAAPASTGGFGQPSFGNPPPFAQSVAPAFGTPAASTGFSGGATPAFGKSSTLGGAKLSWANTGFGSVSTAQGGASGFGKPSFGSATPIGGGSAVPSFGGPTPLGSRPATFGGAASPAFGQSGGLGKTGTFGGASTAIPFGSSTSKTSGFTSFAGTNGISGFGAVKADGESPFGKTSGSSTFGGTTGASPFASKTDAPSLFGQTKPLASFGSGDGFKIESSFQGDGTAKDDLPKPANPGMFGFGGSFGDMLGETKKVTSPTHDKEAEMAGDSDAKSNSDISVKDDNSESAPEEARQPNDAPLPLVTPPSTLNQPKTTPAPPLSGLFGNGSTQQTTTPQAPPTSNAGFSFGGLSSTTPKETPAPKTIFGQNKPLFRFDQTPKPGVEENDDKAQTPKASPEQTKGNIKAKLPSDDEITDLRNIPEAPLPPDPTSKASYSIGGTSASSNRSRAISNDDTPLLPDLLQSSGTRQGDGLPEGPEDDGEFSSDFEGSGEDVTQDISPIDGPSVENTDEIQMSPESSFGRGDKSSEESPTGGLFTKVTTGEQSQKSSRALFGEVGPRPVFDPPTKTQESPRSPSPVRKLLPNNLLRPDAARSVSAPSKPASVIEQRRAQLGQSGLSGQAFPSRDSSATRAKAQAKVLADAKAKAEAEATELEDDEDERLRQELAQPVSPSQDLAPFVPFQQSHSEEALKTGIPGQIERLYQDINSMIDTLGINARSLSSFMLYQQGQEPNDSWPHVLKSETPLDALNDEWVAGDITRLHEGVSVLEAELAFRKPVEVAEKLQQCQELLSRDLPHLRTISAAVRRTLDAQTGTESNLNAPLSAEQASIQHDLRKAATSVQLKLTQAEETLSVLRAKLAESAPKKENGLTRSASQRKPTVEAVTNTIAKMTAMAEAKSTEIDVLEAKLKKLELMSGRQQSLERESTPERLMSNLRLSNGYRAPGSSSGSVYHTPDSKFGRSTSSTPRLRPSMNGNAMVSAEDRQAWKEKATRKKEVASVLKRVLMERNQAKAA
jgi:nucleoporin NUP159